MKALTPVCVCVYVSVSVSVYLADSFHSNSPPSCCSVSISVNSVGVGVLSSSPSMWRSRSAAGDTATWRQNKRQSQCQTFINFMFEPCQKPYINRRDVDMVHWQFNEMVKTHINTKGKHLKNYAENFHDTFLQTFMVPRRWTPDDFVDSLRFRRAPPAG